LHLLPSDFALVLVGASARNAAAHIAYFPFAIAALQNILYLAGTRQKLTVDTTGKYAKAKWWHGRAASERRRSMQHFDIPVGNGRRLRVQVYESFTGGGENLRH
jgi:hypothetical protein